MIDYLIVGSGLAGIAFAETALQNHKQIVVADSNLFSSSKVAAGLYNPVVLKRFNTVADAPAHLALLHSFYGNIESKLNHTFNYKKPILRKFSSIEEQNNWFIAADKASLSPYLAAKLRTDFFEGIEAPYDYGEVNGTGYVEVASLLQHYKVYLESQELLRSEVFDHNFLELYPEFIQYKDIKAGHIIFAEGFGMHQNPYFNHLPLDGAKGELLIIKAPGLALDVIVNTSVFILPMGNDLFKVGATYNWTDKTDFPTQAAKEELLERIRETLNCDFEVVDHLAGVRPTVKDRKPLLGTCAQSKHVHLLNGLGTRGVMLGPAMAKILFEHIELGTPLPREVDIKRFEKKS